MAGNSCGWERNMTGWSTTGYIRIASVVRPGRAVRQSTCKGLLLRTGAQRLLGSIFGKGSIVTQRAIGSNKEVLFRFGIGAVVSTPGLKPSEGCMASHD